MSTWRVRGQPRWLFRRQAGSAKAIDKTQVKGYTSVPGFHLCITGIRLIGIMKGKIDIDIGQFFCSYRVMQVEIGASESGNFFLKER